MRDGAGDRRTGTAGRPETRTPRSWVNGHPESPLFGAINRDPDRRVLGGILLASANSLRDELRKSGAKSKQS